MADKDLFVRIRHGGELIKVKNFQMDCHGSSTKLAMTIEKEVFGVASGQSAVFYTGGGECLGGGVIV